MIAYQPKSIGDRPSTPINAIAYFSTSNSDRPRNTHKTRSPISHIKQRSLKRSKSCFQVGL
ncbi:hypothetical protein [Pseudanabaena sp. 'Roaring Creek']|uniref:hypothetical protein n=1 Tax=Pseudanabaena sp. 'Roaring Creek' TaxID=1681830 RepID=UPI000A861F18|nr:hypothetical protein [Pseudanabaena sp. 'Roaring Creek']